MGATHFTRALAAAALALTAALGGIVATASSSTANPATNTTTTTINAPSLVSSTSGSFTVSGSVSSQFQCAGTLTLYTAKYNKGTNTYVAQPTRTVTQSVTSTSSGGAYSFNVSTSGMGNATWEYRAEFTPAGPCVGSTAGPVYTSVYKVDSAVTATKSGNTFTFTVSASDADTAKVGTPTGTISLTTSNSSGTCTLNASGTCTITTTGSLTSARYSGNAYYNERTITTTS